MLSLPDLDHKSYWDKLKREEPLPEIACPDPACLELLLRGHGWHKRRLGGQKVELRRLRCPRCRVTHVLLPEDVCAYQDLTLDTLEQTMEAAGPTAAAHAAGEPEEKGRRRARRHRSSSVWKAVGYLLSTARAVWERIVATVGLDPGKLVRLRRELWSDKGYFLGGPAGLFRHGRPGLNPRLGSTQVGPVPRPPDR